MKNGAWSTHAMGTTASQTPAAIDCGHQSSRQQHTPLVAALWRHVPDVRPCSAHAYLFALAAVQQRKPPVLWQDAAGAAGAGGWPAMLPCPLATWCPVPLSLPLARRWLVLRRYGGHELCLLLVGEEVAVQQRAQRLVAVRVGLGRAAGGWWQWGQSPGLRTVLPGGGRRACVGQRASRKREGWAQGPPHHVLAGRRSLVTPSLPAPSPCNVSVARATCQHPSWLPPPQAT